MTDDIERMIRKAIDLPALLQPCGNEYETATKQDLATALAAAVRLMRESGVADDFGVPASYEKWCRYDYWAGPGGHVIRHKDRHDTGFHAHAGPYLGCFPTLAAAMAAVEARHADR